MVTKKKNSTIEKEYTKIKINKKTIKDILNHPQFYRGHVRTAVGKIYTDDEFKKRSDKILRKKMP